MTPAGDKGKIWVPNKINLIPVRDSDNFFLSHAGVMLIASAFHIKLKPPPSLIIDQV